MLHVVGVTVLHIASLTEHKVIVYGVTPLQSAQLQERITLLNLHSILTSVVINM